VYLIATWTSEVVAKAGAEVVGPCSSCADALVLLEKEHVDAAILDIGLSDGLVFPVARKLAAEWTPFIFLTGYPDSIVPAEFAAAPVVTKPLDGHPLCERLARLLASSAMLPSDRGVSGNP
jgi:DNA-binding response OmpR family regulator